MVGRAHTPEHELLALWGMLYFANILLLQKIAIYGDLKIIIEIAYGKNALLISNLNNWLDCIMMLKESFVEISFTHVYKQWNIVADALSKKGLSGALDIIHFKWRVGDANLEEGEIVIC